MMNATVRVFVVLSALAQSAAPGLKPDWAVVLPAESVAAFNAKFFKWCSRSGPTLAGGHWTPSAELIRDLEPALAVALEKALAQTFKNASARPAITDYYRQYIGMRSGSRRVVYINGFHRRHLEITAKARPDRASAWQTDVVHVCDGGAYFFGAEYDPETRQVGVVHFNAPGAVPTQ